MGGAENKDFRLSGHLCASTIVYWPGQITNLTGQKAILFGQKAILFGISPMAACYFQLWGGWGVHDTLIRPPWRSPLTPVPPPSSATTPMLYTVLPA